MLNELNIKERYKVINKDLYAVFEETNEQRKINEDGCNVRKETQSRIAQNQQLKADLEKQIEEIDNAIIALQLFDAELLKCGFCAMDKVIKDRHPESGQIVRERTGHQPFCRNLKKGGRA